MASTSVEFQFHKGAHQYKAYRDVSTCVTFDEVFSVAKAAALGSDITFDDSRLSAIKVHAKVVGHKEPAYPMTADVEKCQEVASTFRLFVPPICVQFHYKPEGPIPVPFVFKR